MARSGFDDDGHVQLGAGTTFTLKSAAPEDGIRFQVPGEAFPRVLISALGLFMGDGTVAPTLVGTGGGGGLPETPLGINHGGTASTTAAAALTALGGQPLDSDLTAIAALTTTSFGRNLLTAANSAGLISLAGLGTAAVHAATDFDLSGAAAAAQAASQPLDSDLTAIAALATTSYGRSFLVLADQAGLLSAIGNLPESQIVGLSADLAARVVGPSSAVDGHVAVFDGTTGKLLKDGGVLGSLAAKSTITSADITDGTITDVDVASANKDGTAGTASLRTLGTGATQAAAGNDSRLSDARTPSAHHATHEMGGSDAITSLDASVLHSGTVPTARLPTLDVVPAPVADVSANNHKITSLANATTGTDALNRQTGDARYDLTGAAAAAQAASQPLAADLTSIAALTPANNDFLQRKSGVWTNRTPAQAAVDLGIPASLNVLLGSIDVPRRSLDRFRGAPNGVDTVLNGAINSTVTTIVTMNVNLCAAGEYPLLQVDSERMQVLRGQGTTTLIVKRGVDGTTAASHADQASIVRDKVRHIACVGDSTCAGVTSVVGEYDIWVERFRRIVNERFGGSLGHGYQGPWRFNHASSPTVEYDYVGSWFSPDPTANAYSLGPWHPYFGSGTGVYVKWTRPAKVRVKQIDVWWIMQVGVKGEWSYSTDGGSTWIDNPTADVDIFASAATTLGSADNARALSYWDGTKTMTLASVSGIASNAGFFILDVGSGASTFKCRALFTYDGVSGSTLTNVQYVGPAMYASLTTTTGDTAQQQPEIRKTPIVVADPADFRVRGATAAGTAHTVLFFGYDIWSSVPVFGTTKGVKVHNFGFSGNTLGAMLGARTVNDIGTTSGSPTMTSVARGVFTSADVGSQVINANVPAGTIITAVGSTTSCTLSANATGSVTAGAVANPTTIQGQRAQWDAAFNGSPASLLPGLIVDGCWTNDGSAPTPIDGGDQTMQATFTSGSPNVTITTGNGVEPLDVGALFMDLAGTYTPSGTTILTRTDSTHIVLSANALANGTNVAVNLGAASTTVAQGIKDRLGILHSGGIAGTGITAYADRLLIVPFEQGNTRLNGVSSTSAYQATYRAAMHAWATANKVTTLDIYNAWAAEGNVGYAAAVADGLMDTTDTAAFHEGPVGYRDMASRITRLLEFA